MKLHKKFFAHSPAPSPCLISPRVFTDSRGYFFESYRATTFTDMGICEEWVQENSSFSVQKGVIRGLHLQAPPAGQAKLVQVTRGKIFDVFVDVRKESPSYGQWESCILSDTNHHILYLPRGFAHGFSVLKEQTHVLYKCSNYYAPDREITLAWNDPDLAIPWPSSFPPILSSKDSHGRAFADFISPW
ncbi:dTDP-4-dehydrorhamnose 3,5-epimerase [Chitinivibrio alkaliphilus]|uniref:dTDP-4-dehydrorhamnose 3,5-epimerase n=1 Tax=Chitinivibrio alkaliphilus ACht1 TaxID=1313304 RepID=U7D3T2_9BACT|nr:dTDP-4-dehydrorhamnose 3,5-epimerase [Chitinivibrio alkaliphilus]ERP31164.1 dTDP-4-dehydrorhamnose 3,5-epimerase [Chitinivibrio alkaliphilus ACht1]